MVHYRHFCQPFDRTRENQDELGHYKLGRETKNKNRIILKKGSHVLIRAIRCNDNHPATTDDVGRYNVMDTVAVAFIWDELHTGK